jgi:hypothetical protein
MTRGISPVDFEFRSSPPISFLPADIVQAQHATAINAFTQHGKHAWIEIQHALRGGGRERAVRAAQREQYWSTNAASRAAAAAPVAGPYRNLS